MIYTRIKLEPTELPVEYILVYVNCTRNRWSSQSLSLTAGDKYTQVIEKYSG